MKNKGYRHLCIDNGQSLPPFDTDFNRTFRPLGDNRDMGTFENETIASNDDGVTQPFLNQN